MHRTNYVSSCAIAVIVAIGCSSSTPQDAAAKPADEAPMQLAEAPAGAPAPAGSATVQVTVKFSGSAPAAKAVKMDADPVCRQQHARAVSSEDVVVNGNGTLKNVFVYVKEGVKGAYPAPAIGVTLNQEGCWYMPHVFGLQVNQPLEILNSDATLHNVNVKPAANAPFNIAQPVAKMKTTKKFAKPEVMVKFKCNVHPWMNAYAGVLEHPFFGVSSDAGTATLSGLPAGTYIVETWHEVYGTQVRSVTLGDGESTSIEFSYQGQ